jgi:hypothetical protein
MSKLHVWIVLAAVASVARADAGADEAKHDEAALRAVDKHWGDAETEGDVAYLAELLAPEYRSIGVTGEATTRARLLEKAAKRTTEAARAEARKASQAFTAAHPTGVSVVIRGDVGIVSFYNPERGADHAVRGADVFVYQDHRWRAVISLHNSAP